MTKELNHAGLGTRKVRVHLRWSDQFSSSARAGDDASQIQKHGVLASDKWDDNGCNSDNTG